MMSKQNDWENPSLTGRNRLAPHAYFFGYECEADASTYERERSYGYQSLSGAWRFRLFNGPATVPQQALLSIADDWDEVQVPHMWQFDGYGVCTIPTSRSRSPSTRRWCRPPRLRACTSGW